MNVAMPSLDAILHDPTVVAGLPKSALTTLFLNLSVVQSALAASLANRTNEAPEAVAEEADKMLTVDEASLLLRRKRQWIYRHATTLPFVKRISRKSLLCSEAGLKRWLKSRKGD